MARGNFRRRQILFPTDYDRSSESSDTDPRNLGGGTRVEPWTYGEKHSGSYHVLNERVPTVRSVARVGDLSFYSLAMDPDGQVASNIIFSTSRGPNRGPKFKIRFPRRRRSAQGRERPGGVRG